MRSIAEITKKMIAFSEGNLHDINHFLKVWAFARTIGISEGLDEEAQFILEVSALIHDVACPLCRKKYGCTDGKLQEKEGAPLAAEFLADAGLTAGDVITAVDDIRIGSITELKTALRNYAPGDTVTLTVYRAGTQSAVQVTLDEYIPQPDTAG